MAHDENSNDPRAAAALIFEAASRCRPETVLISPPILSTLEPDTVRVFVVFGTGLTGAKSEAFYSFNLHGHLECYRIHRADLMNQLNMFCPVIICHSDLQRFAEDRAARWPTEDARDMLTYVKSAVAAGGFVPVTDDDEANAPPATRH